MLSINVAKMRTTSTPVPIVSEVYTDISRMEGIPTIPNAPVKIISRKLLANVENGETQPS